MTFSSVTLDYTFNQEGGASLSALEAAMASVPVPLDLLEAIGVLLDSDNTTNPSGVIIKREIVALLKAPTPATAAPIMTGDKSEVASVSVTASGDGYAALPVVKVVGQAVKPAIVRPFLDLLSVQIVNGGSGYTAPNIYFEGGLEIPQVDQNGLLLRDGKETQGCVQGLTLVNGGRGYSVHAVVQFLCELAPGGHFPVASIALDANGSITSILLTDSGSGLLNVPKVVVYDPHSPPGKGAIISPRMGVGTVATGSVSEVGGGINLFLVGAHGGPYVSLPKVVVTDTVGSGAVIVPIMEIKEIDVVFGGQGYHGAAPTITIQDFFDSLFGANSSTAAAPFFNLMKTAIEQAVGTPVVAAAPVVA